jgi:outer membrane protein TolC
MKSAYRYPVLPIGIALGVVALARPAHALQSLEVFAESAKNKSFSAREADATIAQKKADATTSDSKLLPTVTATGSYTHNQYASIATLPTGANTSITKTIVASDQLNANLTLSVPLIDVGAWERIRASNRSIDSPIVRRESTGLEAEKQVARDYYQLVANEALIASAKEIEHVSEENEKIVKAHFDAGTGANDADVARARSETLRDMQTVTEAEYQSAVARRTLQTDSGLAPEAGVASLSEDLLEEAPLEKWAARVEGLASVRAANLDVLALESSATATRNQWFPTVAMFATEAFTNAPGFGTSPSYSFGLTANWRFDWGNTSQERSANAAKEIAAISAEQTHTQANDDLFSAHLRVHSQIEKARAAQAGLEASEATARITRERWKAGKATLFDTIQADRDVLSAATSKISAFADLALARALLRLTAGLAIGGSP